MRYFWAMALAFCVFSLRAELPSDLHEVWFDPRGTAGVRTADGSYGNPLGGSGTAFDTNMRELCAGQPGAPKYPNAVIHLRAGTYLTSGWRFNAHFEPNAAVWRLRQGQRLAGDGMDTTIIRRANPDNDLFYVIGSAPGETGVEIADLTVDANYWGSSNPRISGGGVNFGNLARARGIRVIGTSGNTTVNGGDAEVFSLRMSGTTLTGEIDRTATGGLIENCEISHIKGGYVSGLMAGAGQIMIQNNRIFLPHWTPGSTENGYNNKTFAINLADAVNTMILGNFTSGGYTGIYSDTGIHTNLMIAHNQFLDAIRGIDIMRSYAAPVDSVMILDNIIQLSAEAAATDKRFGIILHSEAKDRSSRISQCTIRGNIVKGGRGGPNTWGIYLQRVNSPLCHDNQMDDGDAPGGGMQTYFDTAGGYIYNLINQHGTPVDKQKWRAREGSAAADAATPVSIGPNDPASTYAVKSIDRYVGVQKPGVTLLLPDPASVGGKDYILANETGKVLKGTGVKCVTNGQTISGSEFFSLAQPYTSIRVVSNGSSWIRY